MACTSADLARLAFIDFDPWERWVRWAVEGTVDHRDPGAGRLLRHPPAASLGWRAVALRAGHRGSGPANEHRADRGGLLEASRDSVTALVKDNTSFIGHIVLFSEDYAVLSDNLLRLAEAVESRVEVTCLAAPARAVG